MSTPPTEPPPTSLGRDAWRRVTQNKLALVSLGIVAAIAFIGYTAPIILSLIPI